MEKYVGKMNVHKHFICTGKKVIVCAHRYQRRGPDYNWGQGLCYTLTQVQ